MDNNSNNKVQEVYEDGLILTAIKAFGGSSNKDKIEEQKSPDPIVVQEEKSDKIMPVVPTFSVPDNSFSKSSNFPGYMNQEEKISDTKVVHKDSENIASETKQVSGEIAHVSEKNIPEKSFSVDLKGIAQAGEKLRSKSIMSSIENSVSAFDVSQDEAQRKLEAEEREKKMEQLARLARESREKKANPEDANAIFKKVNPFEVNPLIEGLFSPESIKESKDGEYLIISDIRGGKERVGTIKYETYVTFESKSTVANADIYKLLSQCSIPLFNIMIHLAPESADKTLKFLKKQHKAFRQQKLDELERTGGSTYSPELEAQMTKLLELQANLVDGRTKMFRTYIMVRVESDTEEGLKSQVRSIFDGAKGYSLEPIRLRYIQLDIRESFGLGGDPGVLNGLIFSGRLPFVYVPMEDVAQLPFFRVREDKNIGGIPIGEDIKTGRFMCRDLWNGNNYNSFMSGESGSGKSFAVKTLSVREYFSGARVLVVDPEGEFKKITEHIGGRYIDLVKTGIGAEKINPFDFSYPRSIIYSYGRAEVENNIMKYMNGFIVGLGDDAREIYGIETVFRREFLSPLAHLVVMICNQSHVDSRHFSKVEILLNDFFRAKFNISPGDPEPYFDMMNNPQSFKGFYSYLESLGDEDESIVAIRQGIYPYGYELGSKADIFSSTKTNISIDDQWVAFGLKGADEDAMSVLMYVVMTYIQNSIFAQKNLQKTRLVVDEAHTFTQNDPEVTAFIRKLVLRARKYFIGVTLVTQNISQLFGGSQNREMNNSLFANLTNYLFLAQKEIGIDEMMQYCKISAPEALFMRSITKAKQEYEILKDTGRGSTEFRGQGLFMSSSGTDTVKIICEPYIFDFINTDPQKKSAVEA